MLKPPTCDMAGSEDTKAIKDSFYKQSAKTTYENALTKPWSEPMSAQITAGTSAENISDGDWEKTFKYQGQAQTIRWWRTTRLEQTSRPY